jgi:hypothetical protein
MSENFCGPWFVFETIAPFCRLSFVRQTVYGVVSFVPQRALLAGGKVTGYENGGVIKMSLFLGASHRKRFCYHIGKETAIRNTEYKIKFSVTIT